jgi:hypothetical protein
MVTMLRRLGRAAVPASATVIETKSLAELPGRLTEHGAPDEDDVLNQGIESSDSRQSLEGGR